MTKSCYLANSTSCIAPNQNKKSGYLGTSVGGTAIYVDYYEVHQSGITLEKGIEYDIGIDSTSMNCNPWPFK